MLWIVLAACGPIAAPEGEPETSAGDGSGATTSTGGTTSVSTSLSTTNAATTFGTSPPPIDTTTAVDTGPPATSEVTTDSCVDFIGCPPDGGLELECDVWTQDCPRGEKCMARAADGGMHWNATRCSPLSPSSGQLGDPCTVEGSYVSGIDDCGLGLQCLWVDPDTNQGTCAANCSGNEANPLCSAATHCAIAFEGTMIPCLPTCNPFGLDCMPGATCVPTSSGDAFVCAPAIAPTLGEHEACDSPWDCRPGLVCTGGGIDSECASGTCCAEFCNLLLGGQCGGGQACIPWYEDGQAPPGLENLGVCAG